MSNFRPYTPSDEESFHHVERVLTLSEQRELGVLDRFKDIRAMSFFVYDVKNDWLGMYDLRKYSGLETLDIIFPGSLDVDLGDTEDPKCVLFEILRDIQHTLKEVNLFVPDLFKPHYKRFLADLASRMPNIVFHALDWDLRNVAGIIMNSLAKNRTAPREVRISTEVLSDVVQCPNSREFFRAMQTVPCIQSLNLQTDVDLCLMDRVYHNRHLRDFNPYYFLQMHTCKYLAAFCKSQECNPSLRFLDISGNGITTTKKTLPRLLSSTMPHLLSLVFRDARFHNESFGLLAAGLQGCLKLQSLQFIKCAFHNDAPFQLKHFFGSTKSLEHLRIDRCFSRGRHHLSAFLDMLWRNKSIQTLDLMSK